MHVVTKTTLNKLQVLWFCAPVAVQLQVNIKGPRQPRAILLCQSLNGFAVFKRSGFISVTDLV